MTRHVHGVYAPAGEAGYATPNGEIVQVPKDFAFADTVVALDEELPVPSRPPPSIPPPPSVRPPNSRPPASYREQHTRQHEMAALHAQQVQHMQMQQMQMQQMQMHVQGSISGPISRPPPSYPHGQPQGEEGLVTSVRGAFQRAKHTIDSSRGEMKELWSATETTDPVRNRDEKDPVVRLARRIATLWNFFEWDKDDVARAAWIGLAVFVIVVCGAFALR
ncbi:MAG: hypothetical protein U0270_09540 [Labilithrix sp.]